MSTIEQLTNPLPRQRSCFSAGKTNESIPNGSRTNSQLVPTSPSSLNQSKPNTRPATASANSLRLPQQLFSRSTSINGDNSILQAQRSISAVSQQPGNLPTFARTASVLAGLVGGNTAIVDVSAATRRHHSIGEIAIRERELALLRKRQLQKKPRVYGRLPEQEEPGCIVKEVDVKKLFSVTDQLLKEKERLRQKAEEARSLYSSSARSDVERFNEVRNEKESDSDSEQDSEYQESFRPPGRVRFALETPSPHSESESLDNLLKTTRPFSAKSQGGISTVFGTDIEGEDDDDLDLDDEQFFHQQFMLNVDLCVKRARKIPKPDKKPGSASVYGDRNRIGGEMGYIKPLKPVPRVSSAPTTLKTPGSTGSRPTSAGSQIPIRPKSAPLLRKDKSKAEENEIVHQFLQCQIAEENNKIDKSAIMLKDMLMKRKQESQATNEKESMKALQFAGRFIKKYVKQVLEEDKLIMVAATAAEYDSIPYQEALALSRTRAADTTTRNPDTHGHSLAYRKGRRERASIAEPDFWKPLNKKPYERTKTDVEVLYKMARKIPAFAKLNDYYLGEIVKVVTLVEFEEDEYVFRQGEEGTAWFIIISGSVSISITKTGDLNDSFVIRHMVAGEGFGDIALINKGPRTASVKAVCPSQLLKVEREDYDRLLKAMYVNETTALHIFLRKVPVFADWTKESLLAVTKRVFRNSYKIKESIYVEGQELDTIYFLKTGIVSVVKTIHHDNHRPPTHVILGLIQPLQYFGEEGFQRNSKFASVSSNTTMIAGDATKMTKEEIHVSIIAKTQLNERGQKGKKSTGGSAGENEIEVVQMAYFEAMEILPSLDWMPWNLVTPAQLVKLHKQNQQSTQWLKKRRHEMDVLVKEQFMNPNLSIQKVRKEARCHKTGIRVHGSK